MKQKTFTRLLGGFWVLALLFSFLLPMQFHAHAAENPFTGKTIAILGDSISTFAGISNDASVNSAIGKNAVYYADGHYGVTRKDPGGNRLQTLWVWSFWSTIPGAVLLF